MSSKANGKLFCSGRGIGALQPMAVPTQYQSKAQLESKDIAHLNELVPNMLSKVSVCDRSAPRSLLSCRSSRLQAGVSVLHSFTCVQCCSVRVMTLLSMLVIMRAGGEEGLLREFCLLWNLDNHAEPWEKFGLAFAIPRCVDGSAERHCVSRNIADRRKDGICAAPGQLPA